MSALDDLSRFDAFLKKAEERKAPRPTYKEAMKDFEAYKAQETAPVDEDGEKTKKPKQPDKDFL